VVWPPPVIIIEVGDVGAVREITENTTQHPTRPPGAEAAMSPSRRISGVEHLHQTVERPRLAYCVQHRKICSKLVYADQDMYANAQILHENGAQCIRKFLSKNGRNHHCRVERILQFGAWLGVGLDETGHGCQGSQGMDGGFHEELPALS
jgi:hypothetical protein